MRTLPRTFSRLLLGRTSSPEEKANREATPMVVVVVVPNPTDNVSPVVLNSVLGADLYPQRTVIESVQPNGRKGKEIRVFISPKPLDPATIEALQISGLDASHDVHFLYPHEHPGLFTDGVLSDRKLLKIIRRMGGKRTPIVLDPSQPSLNATRIAHKLHATTQTFTPYDKDLMYLFSKSGYEQVLNAAGAIRPRTIPDIKDVSQLARALVQLYDEKKARGGDPQRFKFKLDEGSSGDANGDVFIPPPIKTILENGGSVELRSHELTQFLNDNMKAGQWETPSSNGTLRVRNAVLVDGEPFMLFDGSGMNFEALRRELPLGAILQDYVDGVTELTPSPSVKWDVSADADPVLQDFCEQILAPGGVFLGSIFPPHPSLRPGMIEGTLAVAEEYRRRGFKGRLGEDLIAQPLSKDCEPVLLTDADGNPVRDFFCRQMHAVGEWNHIDPMGRKGGTTHAFEVFKRLVGGGYDEDHNWIDPTGQSKHYVSFDHIVKEALRWMPPETVLDIAARHGLLFDDKTKTGFHPHLLGLVDEYGKFGATAIANSREEAVKLMKRLFEAIDIELAQRGALLPAVPEKSGHLRQQIGPQAKVEKAAGSRRFQFSEIQLGEAPNGFLRSAVRMPGSEDTFATASNFCRRSEVRIQQPGKVPVELDTEGIEYISHLTASEDTLFAATPDGRIVGWSADGETKWEHSFDSSFGLITALSTWSSGNTVAVGFADGSVKFIDMDGQDVGGRPCAKGAVESICHSPDGSMLAIGDTKGTVHVFTTADNQIDAGFSLSEDGDETRPMTSIAISPDNKTIAAASRFDLHLHDKVTGETNHISHSSALRQVSFSPDGTTVLAVDSRNELFQYDLKTGHVVSVKRSKRTDPKLSYPPVSPVTHSSDGKRAAVVSNTGAVHHFTEKPSLSERARNRASRSFSTGNSGSWN